MIHIVQDDCAPDGFEYFEKEVLKQIGFQFSIIKSAMKLKEDLGDTLIYHWGAYEIKNEIGIYSIKSIFTEAPAVPEQAQKYKFRAECGDDVIELFTVIPRADIIEHDAELDPEFSGLDVEVEIELKTIDLDGLRELMREVPDGHVMVETVMPIKEYTGERDYEL